MTGMGVGTVAGLVQDGFSGGMLGLNGLSKTTVGYLSGIIGRWLIIRGWGARFLFFFAASAVDLLILALVGSAVERPVVIGEGIAPLILCFCNGFVGAVVLGLRESRSRKLG
jgi:cell shape-determining protein MreD